MGTIKSLIDEAANQLAELEVIDELESIPEDSGQKQEKTTQSAQQQLGTQPNSDYSGNADNHDW